MNLRYFTLSDDKETLKKKYKQLAFQNHPDKNLHDVAGSTKRMQDINEEFRYCLKNGGIFRDEIGKGADLGVLVSELFATMLEELIAQEKNQSVVIFLTNMKDQFRKYPRRLDDFIKVLWNVGSHMKNHAYKVPYEKIKKKKNPYT